MKVKIKIINNMNNMNIYLSKMKQIHRLIVMMMIKNKYYIIRKWGELETPEI